jgi:hypothetical protein
MKFPRVFFESCWYLDTMAATWPARTCPRGGRCE